MIFPTIAYNDGYQDACEDITKRIRELISAIRSKKPGLNEILQELDTLIIIYEPLMAKAGVRV